MQSREVPGDGSKGRRVGPRKSQEDEVAQNSAGEEDQARHGTQSRGFGRYGEEWGNCFVL